MVMSLTKYVLPQAFIPKDKQAASGRRETKGNTKLKETVEVDRLVQLQDMPSASGHWRKNDSKTTDWVLQTKGKKK